jgi:hypothetical protein
VIAKPEDDRDRRRRGDMRAINTELARIETAGGKLDRHVDPPLLASRRSLDALRVPSLEDAKSGTTRVFGFASCELSRWTKT